MMKRHDQADELVSVYRDMLLTPRSWLHLADELLNAEAALPPDKFGEVRAMLGAYALENLLKARIVQVKRQKVSDELEKHLKKGGKFVLFDHDLSRLAKEACLAEFEPPAWQQFFVQLTRSAKWTARYPVCTKPAELRLPGTAIPGYVLTNMHNEAERDNITAACAYLKQMITKGAEDRTE